MNAFDPGHPDGHNSSADEVLAPDGRLSAGETYTIPARQGRAFRVRQGERFSVINHHGTQVADFWAFVDGNPHEHLSMEHLRPFLRRTRPQPGDGLVSNTRRPLLTLEHDTSDGVHDTLIAACDIHRYHQLGHDGYHDNCTDNLRMALAALGITAPAIPCPLNLWMNTPADAAGAIRWLEPTSRPGDQVTFRAETDVVIVISCCPMDLLPINGAEAQPTSIQVRLEG